MTSEAGHDGHEAEPQSSRGGGKLQNKPRNLDSTLVALAAACISFIAFFVYYRAGDLLLYGDAVAHINIARRVFDSRTPGLLQLGTVWLPLPHLLILPFVVNRWLWQTGVGASIPSMLSYVFATVGIFRLARVLLRSIHIAENAIRFTAFACAGLFALNPNLLYLQSTAMTEPLYLAFFIWAVVYMQGFLSAAHGQLSAMSRDSWHLLIKCALCSAAASLTRYDGWFLAITLAGIPILLYLRERKQTQDPTLRPLVLRFVVLLAVAPVLWLAYNAIVYRNPLEFANGPYSAKAIEQRSLSTTPAHPGTRSLPVAALYFAKCAQINVAPGRLGWLWLLLALVATGALFMKSRIASPVLLWSPLAFYALTVAYGGVPIYMPDWYPHSAYNVRYGLELLPALSVLIPLAVLLFMRGLSGVSARRVVVATASLLLAASYVALWKMHPVCYREAFINSRTRLALESQLSNDLKALPLDSSFLMYLGSHVGALQQAGIPLCRAVSEGNHRVWMQPSDPEGLWERTLAHPAQFVDFVVAVDGDPVADAMRSQSLPVLSRIHVEGQPAAMIYRAR